MKVAIEIDVLTKDELRENQAPVIQQRATALNLALTKQLKAWDEDHPHNSSIFVNWNQICDDLGIATYHAERLIKAIVEKYRESGKWKITQGGRPLWFFFS